MLLVYRSRRPGLMSAAALVAVSSAGCAVEPTVPQHQDRTCRSDPTFQSTSKVFAGAIAGAALDRISGGGDGFERAIGAAVDDSLHKRCPTSESARTPGSGTDTGPGKM